MFEATCRDREFERLLTVLVSIQSVDQCGSKAVAAADPVDDVRELVVARQAETIGNMISPKLINSDIAYPRTFLAICKASLANAVMCL